MLPRQRAFPLGGRECGRNSRCTGGCGFGGMGAGVRPQLNDGQGRAVRLPSSLCSQVLPCLNGVSPNTQRAPLPWVGGMYHLIS